ncbi:MAG: ferrous iron transport protein B [Flavobacteriaceae bacterium]|nr:ferrous iron transport protein B [Flavobacteriaceae bacterium]
MGKQINVALIGNPNTGKTSIFNQLTGLNQQVGNYPGITVEKKEGLCKLSHTLKAHIIDLPGTYSLNTTSLDESVVVELLLNKNDKDYPDLAVVISDVENLKRNLLLFTQIKDLQIPTILAINMSDRMQRKGISLDVEQLQESLQSPVILVSARKKTGIDTLKKAIANYQIIEPTSCIDIRELEPEYFDKLKRAFPSQLLYKLWLTITQDVNFGNLNRNRSISYSSFNIQPNESLKRLQHKETIKRYQFINTALKKSLSIDINKAKGLRASLDRILLHPVAGYFIFFAILLLIFQAIYDWASYPMDSIDLAFAKMSNWVSINLPEGLFTNLIAEGVLPGLGGILMFLPQIAILFMFIAILEESGYMSRVVFLTDKTMRRFGLSGKSVVPLISGTACAIPAVMATRNIQSWKERLITILVVPFTTCSARLPVYLIIIALVIPEKKVFGVFNLQGLSLMLLYVLGFLMALLSAYALHKILNLTHKSFFVIEMPNYKMPIWRNVFYTVVEKSKAFVWGAGKIIMAISIILWVMASFGPGERFKNAEYYVSKNNPELNGADFENKLAAHKLEHSYIGIIGRGIEPIVQPLGYDWKIGIAIVSSFAAREVFVGTLATIYSVGSDAEEETLKNRMKAEVNPILGSPVFNFASGISLLLFYAFAMQCMSTLAIVQKETNSWKWPALQLIFMSGFAYLVSLIAYQFLK